MVDRTEEDGCLRKVEECQVEEGQATVVRTLTKLCCNQEKAVQWFHFKEAATGNLLDFEDGNLKISARNVSRSSQMWRLEGGKMFNKKEAGKVLGLRGGVVTMVGAGEGGVMDISFEGGVLLDAASGYQLAASSTGLVEAGHLLAKRQADIVSGIAAATLACSLSGGGSLWSKGKASPVTCDELGGWPAFQELTNIDADTQCWDEVQPSFRLYDRNQKTTLGSQKSHLEILPNGVQTNEIGHLVIVIHGYFANAQIGEWPDEMADLILKHDAKVDAVLTVDWELGAFPPTICGKGVFGANYDEAAANTRYVGVATERIVRQLDQVEGGAFLHCIGHSLGAHTCGFFANAVEKDESYSKAKVDRITAMDPAGPSFTSKDYLEPNGADPIDGAMPLDERLDKDDAVLVDALHTDSDHLGIVPSVGDADFYIGNNLDNLGSDQAGCGLGAQFVCDHGRSWELIKASIAHNKSCWAHFECQGETIKRGCVSSTSVNSLSPRPHYGYWWDGKSSSFGDFGVVLEQDNDPFCLECLDDEQCDAGFKCVSNKCEEDLQVCMQDNQCEEGFKCTENKCQQAPQCGGRRRKRSSTTSGCSSEPSAQCKAEGGYCGNPASCPGNAHIILFVLVLLMFLTQDDFILTLTRHCGGQQMSRRPRQQVLPCHAIPGFHLLTKILFHEY